MKTMALIGSMLIAALVLACSQNAGTTSADMKENSMPDPTATLTAPAVPAMDRAAPAEFETASFGLG